MLNNDNNYMTYNNFITMPTFPYNIIVYLAEKGSEEFWKLLKYNSIDSLDKDNLTYDEKINLIWNGIDTQQQNYNIFLQPLIGNALDNSSEQIQLRLFRYDTVPDTRFQATIIYELDIITHEKCSLVYYNGMLCERTDLIEAFLLNDLNGKEIGGTMPLSFDRQMSRTCKSLMNISNSKSFYGRSLFLGQLLVSPDVGGDCG